MKKLSIGLVAVGLLAAVFCFQNRAPLTGFELEKEAFTFGESAPSEWFFAQRAYPKGRINRAAWREACQKALAMRAAAASRGGADWQFEGPLNFEGRISALAVHPGNSNVIWAGTASGGVFKTANGGQSWQPVFDDAGSLSIGDVAVAPSQPNVLYAGTGEANGGGGSTTYDGAGVYRSSNGGQSWQFIGLENIGNVGRVAIDPTDPARVFVAAMGDLYADTPERGIFRSKNSGTTWEKVLFVSDSTGGIDLAFHPSDPKTIYAAMWERIRRPDRRKYGGASSGIFRSTDGGDTWARLGGGFPTQSVGRIGLSISPANPNMIYAAVFDASGANLGIFRSENGGTAWQRRDQPGGLGNYGATFGWWFGRIYADPTDADHVFALGVSLHESTDGGQTWQDVGNVMHADQHALWIDPNDPAHLIAGNDGGLYFAENGASSIWQKFPALVPNGQFYTCEIDAQHPERLYGGLQDNGTWRRLSSDLADWEHIYGGDGFHCRVDPSDNDFIYAEYQYGALGRSTDGGQSFQNATAGISNGDRKNWSCPLALDPAAPATLYFGTNKVYKSTDRAASWTAVSPDLTKGKNGTGGVVFGTITALGVSPLDGKILWAGSDDGRLHVSKNGGAAWADVSASLPDRWVTRIVPSPHSASTAYLTLSGFRWHEAQPHVLKTTDFGQTWLDISSNLPEAPANDIVPDPAAPGLLYVATDVGVFASENDGGAWEPLGGNALPLVPVTDLQFHAPTRRLLAATYGRGMYSIDLQVLDAESLHTGALDFSLKISPSPLAEAAVLRVFFPEKTAQAELAILDAQGRVVKQIWRGAAQAGWQSFEISRADLPSAGIYFCELRAGASRRAEKFVAAF